MTDREAIIALNSVTGIGAITLRKMARKFGSFPAILSAGEQALRTVPTIGPERARRFYEAFCQLSPEKEIERAERLKVQLVTWVDPEYPPLLKAIADPPPVLYVRGDVSALSRPSVALIGTRHPTVYGRESARKFGYQLAGSGYSIVSGLAVGIDTESHTGAVQAKGITVGVLGGALDRFFPKENEALARQMIENGGAVISEYPFGRSPDRQTFPMRNRIVSGLSKGILVIEAPLGSGTLITVDQALEQGRLIMALPGRIDSPSSRGCHRILREGARLVTTADEVIEELQDLFAVTRGTLLERRRNREDQERDGPDRGGRPLPQLEPDEQALYNLLTVEGETIDTLVRASGIETGRASSILIRLQIKRLAKALPGGRVAKLP